jgi:hypothetical protein
MKHLEWCASEGESPVTVTGEALSKLGLVKPGLKMGGPPSKPKYYSTTDSESVRRLNDDKHRDERSERVPETVCLQAVGALRGDRVLFA